MLCPWVAVSARALVLLPWKGKSHFDPDLGSSVALPDFTVRKWQSWLCFRAIKAHWDGSTCFSWEKAVMLIGMGSVLCQGVVWQQAGLHLWLSPAQGAPVPDSSIFGWSRCDCCAVCIGRRNNAQRNVVFLPRGLKGKLWNFLLLPWKWLSWSLGLCLVLEAWVQPALEFFRLVAEIWCLDRDWIPLARFWQWFLWVLVLWHGGLLDFFNRYFFQKCYVGPVCYALPVWTAWDVCTCHAQWHFLDYSKRGIELFKKKKKIRYCATEKS